MPAYVLLGQFVYDTVDAAGVDMVDPRSSLEDVLREEMVLAGYYLIVLEV